MRSVGNPKMIMVIYQDVDDCPRMRLLVLLKELVLSQDCSFSHLKKLAKRW
jgi:hypothetical protein